MNKHERLKKTFLIFTVVILICFYMSLMVIPMELVSKYITYISVIVVVFLACLYGTIAGIISGLLIGLINTAILLSYTGTLSFPIASAPISLDIFIELFKGENVYKWVIITIVGFAAGWYAEKSYKLRNDLEKRLKVVENSNHDLEIHLNEYKEKFHALSETKVYQRAWDNVMNNNQEAERIFGLIASQISEVKKSNYANIMRINSSMPFVSINNHNSTWQPVEANGNSEKAAIGNSNNLAMKCFDYLVDINPEILAVMNTNGKIMFFNETLMAIYGYTAEDKIIDVGIFDFIISADVKKASANISRALTSGVNNNERYRIKSKDGRNTGQLVSSTISFKCTGNPMSLIACVESGTANFIKKEAPGEEFNPSATVPLTEKSIWCLNSNGSTVFINLQAAALLGYTVEQMISRSIFQFLDKKDSISFRRFINLCKDGARRSLDIEIFTKSGTRIIVNLDVFPSIGEAGTYFGITILIENVTERKLIEEALQHRLSMEKMITDISTKFIDIGIDELDSEIIRVLKMIGDFEGAHRSFVIIYESDKTGEQKQYDVVNIIENSWSQEDESTGSSSVLVHELDNVAISIVIDGESVGLFRFEQKRYSKAWLEEDLKLIKLVGEIIVNALARRYNEIKLKVSEEWLETTLHSIGDAVIATDTDGRIIMLNKMAEDLTGWTREEALQRPLNSIFNVIVKKGTQSSSSTESSQSPLLSEVDNSIILKSQKGTESFISSNKTMIEDNEGKVFGEVIVFRDITEKKLKDDEIRYIGFHDKLTGLYNRAFFEEELSRLDTKRQYPITLILGDANGLKIANDIFGHLEGDKLLQKIASIIKSASRKEDIVARWGGDEFAVILPRTDDKTGAEIRERILAACSVAEKEPIQPSLALGSATKVDDTQDIIWLLKLAEDRMYRHKLLEGKSARNSMLSSLQKMIFEKSYETEEHAKRMLDVSGKVGLAVGLSDDELDELRLLSVLHDMGKIGIPDNVLMKPGKLDHEEWEQMKKHPEKGYNIAKSTQELEGIAEFILYHHERWDGTGYPKGLKGDSIPKLSRILSIVDAYDVITHSRVYKDAQSHDAAIAEIKRCSGTHFDPGFAEVFVKIMDQK